MQPSPSGVSEIFRRRMPHHSQVMFAAPIDVTFSAILAKSTSREPGSVRRRACEPTAAAVQANVEDFSMNKRLVIASALAAAVAAPSLVMAQGRPAPTPTFEAAEGYGL